MNIKELMFLKAISGKSNPNECLPMFFSAGSLSHGGTPSLTNNYGTTINTTSATDNEVAVTQVYTSEYQPTSYRNGFICVGFEKMIEWAQGGKKVIFDADINITENPASVTTLQCLIKSKTYNVDITGGKLHQEWTDGISEQDRDYVEIRCGGCSFTLSNCKLSCE